MPKQIVNLSDTVAAFKDKVNIVSTDLGWRGNLTTTQDSDFVGAINELDAELGTITAGAMGTTAGTVSGAILELETEIDVLNTKVEPSQALTTTATTLADAVNELDAELGTISAGAMGTTASTVSGAIAELEAEVDVLNTKVEQTQSITTTATTLADAINELDAELGTITTGAMGTTASTVSGAIAELQSEINLLDSGASTQLAQIGNLASLDTTAKNNLVAAINELDDRIDTDADFRNKVSATDAGGDGSFAYNQGTGVFTYTGPSASETRAHFSGGTEIGISSGTINHSNISRTNTTSTGSVAYGGTFTAIDSITSNARGHVTAANVKTVTIPAAYSHPSHPGDDMAIDTGALTGATVISDLDLNVTTDTLGHVTDANATVATRTLTLANLGYTGATDANNYVHPNHTGAITSTADGATVLATNAVTTVKINAGAVTNAKLATNSVTQDKMDDDAVGSGELKSVVTLVIYNSAGTAVKTLYGAGS